jgi:hypothetical protein
LSYDLAYVREYDAIGVEKIDGTVGVPSGAGNIPVPFKALQDSAKRDPAGVRKMSQPEGETVDRPVAGVIPIPVQQVEQRDRLRSRPPGPQMTVAEGLWSWQGARLNHGTARPEKALVQSTREAERNIMGVVVSHVVCRVTGSKVWMEARALQLIIEVSENKIHAGGACIPSQCSIEFGESFAGKQLGLWPGEEYEVV